MYVYIYTHIRVCVYVYTYMGSHISAEQKCIIIYFCFDRSKVPSLCHPWLRCASACWVSPGCSWNTSDLWPSLPPWPSSACLVSRLQGRGLENTGALLCCKYGHANVSSITVSLKRHYLESVCLWENMPSVSQNFGLVSQKFKVCLSWDDSKFWLT